jgi:hypothetical protein
MTNVTIVVHEIDPGLKNAAGGRTITIAGLTPKNEIAHVTLTFENAVELEKLCAATTAP